MASNGAILYESMHHIVVVTGLSHKSKNPKTGNILQTWILPRNIHPVQAVRTGNDASVCGDCALRGDKGKDRGCYVQVWKAPSTIWKAYKRGNYPRLTADQYQETFAGRFVRFGSYGEPVLIPFQIVKAIAGIAAEFTGYTHQWRNPLFSAYKRYFMASCDERDYAEAILQGWRTFTVSQRTITGLMICPASREFGLARGYKLDCATCGQCAGLSKQGRSVQIQPHGFGKRYVKTAAQAA